jgi:ligand-binding sensor domain-containing protein
MQHCRFRILLLIAILYASNSASEWLNFTCGNHVSSIVCYRDTVWAGTWGGLAKINSKTDEIAFYNKGNSELTENAITALAMNKNGTLLIGNSHLQMLSQAKWRADLYAGYNNFIYAIAVDQNNNTIAANGRFLCKSDGSQWDSIQLASIVSSFFVINAIAFSSNGDCWVGSNEGLFILHDDTIIDTLDASTALLADTNGAMWAQSARGVRKYFGHSFSQFDSTNSPIKGGDITAMHFDSKRNIWICSAYGLFEYNGLTWNVYTTDNSGLPENSLISLDIDEFDNKWIGTRNNGIVKFDNQSWKKYRTSNSKLSSNSLYSIAIDKNGHAWIGDDSGILKFNGKQWISVDTGKSGGLDSIFQRIYDDSIRKIWAGADIGIVCSGGSIIGSSAKSWYTYDIHSPNKAGRMKRDRNGVIWLATDTGLAWYDGFQWQYYNKENSPMPYNKVGSILMGNDNRILVTSINPNGDVLMSFDGQNWNREYQCQPGIGISAVAIDSKGYLWISQIDYWHFGVEFGYGISEYDGSHWRSFSYVNSGLPSNTVFDIACDNAGKLWVATCGGGIAKFDGVSKWDTYNIRNSGLSDNTVGQIEIDSSGGRWIRTERNGLALFSDSISGVPINSKPRHPDMFSLNAADFRARVSGNLLSISVLTAGILNINAFDLSGKCMLDIPMHWYSHGVHRIFLNRTSSNCGIIVSIVSGNKKFFCKGILTNAK